jgi:voltage-gated potassium channel
LIVISLVTFSIEALPNLSPTTERWLVAKRKLAFVFSFFEIVDLLAIAPFYLASGVHPRSIRALLGKCEESDPVSKLVQIE